jgi:hypothetical protein
MGHQEKDVHGSPMENGADAAPAVVSLMDDTTCVQQLMTCLEIGKALTSTFNMERILVILLDLVSDLIRAKNWTLFLLDPATQELSF